MRDTNRTGAVFDAYADYYDLLYKDKDYEAEAAYIQRLIERHRPGAASVLDLGSGTGRHARLLARRGYAVHGVERSAAMLEQARREQTPPEGDARVVFTQGDIRDIRVDGTFDVVISLFHVMSYMTTNDDLLRAFRTAHAHLQAGGCFIFDFWYGPAVLAQRPTVRVKRMQGERLSVTRLAEPRLDTARSVVDVHYDLFLQDRERDRIEEITETHAMRYLFLPEVDFALGASGFERIHAAGWMTEQAPTDDTWGAVVCCRKS